ncbi:methyltransferase [Sphingomonas sp.]|uniref:methyltransferase n=1 Tax=Sphingomonas sp. TaxID=28214 RepID=UPI001D442563|nr:methyltransferase [Sphingomonas sp.]MBX9797673.1 methyltransferase [Sphingomonas sp.]
MSLSKNNDNSLRLRWLAWRNQWLANPATQRAMMRLPIMRSIVRFRARRMFDRVTGFTYSMILLAFVQLDGLRRLSGAPATVDALAVDWAMAPAAAERLLRAGASIGLVQALPDGRWTLGEEGAALLGNPGVAEMIEHHRLLYADLADPVGLLRSGGGGGALHAYWHYAGEAGQGGQDEVSAYSRLMAATQPFVAEQVIGSYRFARHRAMLDVGGGEGAFAGAVARAVPGLQLGLFDLPAVGERARVRLAAAGVADRVTIHGGSFLHDPLPGGYDLVTLVRVLHDHDDAPAMQLLRSIYAALPSGGRLLIAEPMAGTRGAEASGDGYFGLYLWAMGSGRPRRVDEIGAMLTTCGFNRFKEIATPLPLNVRIIVATRA